MKQQFFLFKETKQNVAVFYFFLLVNILIKCVRKMLDKVMTIINIYIYIILLQENENLLRKKIF